MKTKIIQQGAEAKIILHENSITKDRISKSYRHKDLDKQIRKRRTKAEAKLLEKASKIIDAPKPFFLPEGSYQIKMPFIDGKKLSTDLDKFQLKEQKEIMKIIGKNIAMLHKNDIIHGDLTTSNMILVLENKKTKQKEISRIISPQKKSEERSEEQFGEALGRAGGKAFQQKIFFIDFGLGYISKKIEDKAVDLHLLKQALEAKHFTNWKELFETVSKSYEKTLGKDDAKKIFERITAVEKRGRYRH